MSNEKTKDELFCSYVQGKSVALVGPAASLTGQGLGELIDSYDLVARIKSFVRDDEEDSGARCDILYTTNPFDRCDIKNFEKRKIRNHDCYVFEKYDDPAGVYKEHGIQWIVSSYPGSEWFARGSFAGDFEKLEGFANWRYSSDQPYYDAKAVVSRPNSGFAAFLDIHTKCSELFVCGLDFFRSMYKPGYQSSLTDEAFVNYCASAVVSNGTTRESHLPDKQYELFRKIVEESKGRIKVDPWFDSIMKDRQYDKMYDMKD